MANQIRIMQIGLGPLGLKISEYIDDKSSMKTVAAVDINPRLRGKDLGELTTGQKNNVIIQNSISNVENIANVDVVVLTTTSNLVQISTQINEILDYNLPIVSTCEELTFPWKNDPKLADQIDKKAKAKNVAVVSTGVNPGFLMDSLPTMLTGVCKEVNYINVKRIQDAKSRRIPFQKKIGAGLTLEEFEERKRAGKLRHVGLTESMQFIADAVGWELDHTEDIISPVVALQEVVTDDLTIAKGNTTGVRQIGKAFSKGEEKITLIFEAAVGTGVSYDEVNITGNPNINSRIEGGVNGDVATCSIVLNTIPVVLKASPGLKTMKDLPLISFTY